MLGFIRFIFVMGMAIAAWEVTFSNLQLMLSSQHYDKLPYTVTSVCDKEYRTPLVKDDWGRTKGGGGYSSVTRAECNTAAKAGSYWCKQLRECVSNVTNYMGDLGYNEPVIYLTGRYPKGCRDFGDADCSGFGGRLTGCVSRESDWSAYRDAPVSNNNDDDYQACYPNLEVKEQGGDLDIEYYGYIQAGSFFTFFVLIWWLTGLVKRVFGRIFGGTEE